MQEEAWRLQAAGCWVGSPVGTLRCLQAYLDDECDPDRVWSVARHLGHCPDCFTDAGAIRQVKDAVGSLRTAPDAAAMRRLRDLVATLDAST